MWCLAKKQDNAHLSIPSPGFTALMQSGGSPCVYVVLWYPGASGLPGPSLPARTPSSVFLLSVVFGFWVCVRILTVLGALEDGHKQKDKDVGEEKQ